MLSNIFDFYFHALGGGNRRLARLGQQPGPVATVEYRATDGGFETRHPAADRGWVDAKEPPRLDQATGSGNSQYDTKIVPIHMLHFRSFEMHNLLS